MDFMDANGYKPVAGWIEHYLYQENDASPNNVTWVQREAQLTAA